MLKQLPGPAGPIRRLGRVSAAAVAAVVLLAGCSAGQHAQTVGQQPAIDGMSATTGTIAVQAASVLAPSNGLSYAKGGGALLELVLTNNGVAPFTLVSVSSSAAAHTLLSDAGLPVSPTESSSESASPSASDEPSASSSPTQAASNPSITVPAGQNVQVGYSAGGPNISLSDLNTALFPAQTVPVTFTFASGTTATGITTSTLSMNISVKLASNAPSAPVISEATAPND